MISTFALLSRAIRPWLVTLGHDGAWLALAVWSAVALAMVLSRPRRVTAS